MPVVPGFRSAWHRFVYDTVRIAAGTAVGDTPVTFFTIAIGGGTSPTRTTGTKQIQDTNLQEPRKLPFVAGDMWLNAIRFEILGDTTGLPTPNDVHRLYRNYQFTLLVNNDEYLQAPLCCFPAGGGPYHVGALSTAMLALTTTSLGMISGNPACSSVFVLQKPIGIGQGETFEVNLNGATFTTDAAGGTTLGNGLILRVILEGDVGEAATQ